MKFKPLIAAVLALALVVIAVIFSNSTASRSDYGKDDTKGYINMHEHMQNMDDVEKTLEINERLGITKTLLLGSSDKTIFLTKFFTNYDENNDELLKIHEAYPDNFEVLCATYWHDLDQVAKIESCWKRGAKGVKLYNGHSNFYELPLDDPVMLPVYKYIEDNGLILLIHVNGGKYLDEFERVLTKFPDMKVICPHFCLISRKLDTLTELMDKYPNLYTDTSFGYIEYTAAGFSRFSNNNERFRRFIDKYQDRIFFGTDQVITNIKTRKHADELEHVLGAYLKALTDEEFQLKTTWPEEYGETYKGLNLPEETLQNVLTDGPQKLLDSVPEYHVRSSLTP